MGGGDTQTTTMNQTGGTSYAPWIGQLQQALGGTALGLTQNFLGNASNYGIAGFNPDQEKGFDMLRGSALQYGGGSGSNVPSMDAIMQGGRMNAAQLGAGDFQQFMNPYIQSVIDPTLQNLQRQKANTAAEIDARSAAAGAYGGSRGALQRAQLDRSMGETTAQLVPALLSAGYDRATGLASQNVDRQQQANAANANNALSAYGLGSQLQTADLNRQLAAIGALLSGGQTQQGLAQQSLDLPFTMLARLASVVPGVYDSTSYVNQNSTSPDNSPSPFQQLLGAGATVLGTPMSDFKSSVGGTLLGKLFS